jgi:hypothetical protein
LLAAEKSLILNSLGTTLHMAVHKCVSTDGLFFVTIAPSLTKTITIFIYTALGLTIAHGDIAELLALAI